MNIRQRVFDVFPPAPGEIALPAIVERLEFLEASSVYRAVRALVDLGTVEHCGIAAYRLVEGAQCPQDMRGGKRAGAGRPRGDR